MVITICYDLFSFLQEKFQWKIRVALTMIETLTITHKQLHTQWQPQFPTVFFFIAHYAVRTLYNPFSHSYQTLGVSRLNQFSAKAVKLKKSRQKRKQKS